MKPIDDNIHLQITHSHPDSKAYEIDDCAITHKQWKYTAIDGDAKSIIPRIDSSLNATGNLLTYSTMMLAKLCIPIYFRYDDDNDIRCAIIMMKFEVVDCQRQTVEVKKTQQALSVVFAALFDVDASQIGARQCYNENQVEGAPEKK